MAYIILKMTKAQVIQRLMHDQSLHKILQGNWRITPKKVQNASHALAVFSGVIIAEFTVDENLQVHADDDHKLSFHLTPVLKSSFQGRVIDYPTSNLASVVTNERLAEILKKDVIRYE